MSRFRRKQVAGARHSRQVTYKRVDLRELSRRYQLAFLRRDLAECKRILTTVLKVSPGNLEASLQRARLLGVQCRFPEARASFLKAIELAPVDQREETAIKAGQLARDLYDSSIAEMLCRLAADAGGSVVARLHLAEHLDRMRCRNGALESVESVLKQDANHGYALLLKAKLGGVEGGEVEGVLSGLLERDDLPSEVKVRAGYELGHWRDKQGDYDGAMGAIEEAKVLLSDQAQPFIRNRPLSRQQFTNLSKEMTPEIVKRWGAERFKPLSGPLGVGMIVGHPRSGTTLLEQIVDSHTRSESAEETEIFSLFAMAPLADPGLARQQSFCTVLDRLRSAQIESARKVFRRTMGKVLPLAPKTTLLIDKNPSLSPLIGAFYRFFPEARILAMLRDPRDVVLSCFFQPLLPLNPVTACYTSLPEAALEYAAVMDAYAHSARLLGDSVLQVRYEDLVEDVMGVSHKVLDFYGLPWEESVLDFHERAQKRIVRSPTADAVTEKVHKRATGRWRHYERHLEPCMEVLQPFIERWGYA